MKLNQKVRYGVACLFELSKRPNEFIDSDHIAENQEIPKSYAHKILQILGHAGFVYSHKGLGYRLLKPLSMISAAEIIDLLTAGIDPNVSNPDMGFLLEERINHGLKQLTLDQLVK